MTRKETFDTSPSNEQMLLQELDQIIDRATERVERRNPARPGPVSVADTRASLDRLRAYRHRFAARPTPRLAK